ncbi:MAG: aminodeoxychorismate/anthranilate synthase component II [Gammaproteobacteria bacterium]|nr:aminodeoxychorismate/anthranilate synthase component II [Gammaproteobacteria bacterium]
MVILIDNYDSFVYNLARYVGELGYQRQVFRHDAISVSEVSALNPSHIIISPGPGGPKDAGISLDIIRQLSDRIPILGVCLGHQAIGEAFGGRVVRGRYPMHGKSSIITHNDAGIFAGLVNPIKVGRYHSLIVESETLPESLMVTAWSEQGEIMGLQHRHLPVFGVQFHPESVLTECGYELLQQFLGRSS